MSETNGNGYGKPFVLAPPRSPEEIARDEVRKTMPNLRHQCSRDPRLKRHVGAKWLFDRLSDDSFMHIYGGDGFGKVYTSLIDLRRRYGHDEQTLARWTAVLVETGWIWVHKSWPRWCFGITSICRQPELFAPEYVRIMAKASGEQVSASHGSAPENDPSDKTAGHGFPPENEKTANLGQNHHDPRLTNTQVTVGETAGHGGENRRSRFHQPQVTAGLGRESRLVPTQVTVGGTAGHGRTNRESRGAPTVSDGATKESPREFGSKGGSFKEVCVAGNAPEAPKPHTQVPNFEPLDLRMAARLRPAWGEKAIDTCKGKIYALEQSRNPIPNRQEVIAAYKQRIKDVRKWMVGER